jgi:hypothetical protein
MASGTPALGLGVGGARDALADGVLGTAASEAELLATIARLLAQPKPDSVELAAAAGARFGRETFTAATRTVLNRLMPREHREFAIFS